MATELVERPLTPIEIKQRQVDHLRLLTEIDNYQSEIDEHRRCAKDAANEVARIQSRERELRRELRSGTCWESVHVEPRQKSLEFADTLVERPTDTESHACNPGISATTDEPDPETDPPGHCLKCGEAFCKLGRHAHVCEQDRPELTERDSPPDLFSERYPMARDPVRLRSELGVVCQSIEGAETPSREWAEKLASHGPSFDAVAHWSRVELAWMNAVEDDRNRPELGRPNRLPMPEALREGLGLAKKGKRGARPLSNPSKKGKRAHGA